MHSPLVAAYSIVEEEGYCSISTSSLHPSHLCHYDSLPFGVNYPLCPLAPAPAPFPDRIGIVPEMGALNGGYWCDIRTIG